MLKRRKRLQRLQDLRCQLIQTKTPGGVRRWIGKGKLQRCGVSRLPSHAQGGHRRRPRHKPFLQMEFGEENRAVDMKRIERWCEVVVVVRQHSAGRS